MDDKLRVKGCPLCELFNGNLPNDTKLYYPLDKKDIQNSEFIIVECKICKTPMIIYNEHITELGKDTYGKIIYKCKMLFGSDLKISNRHRIIDDHWHIHRVKGID